MPELPEIEVLARQLNHRLSQKMEFLVASCEFVAPRLRWDLDPALSEELAGQKLLRARRWAKYLIFEFSKTTVVAHLGMSGSWTWTQSLGFEAQKHDHILLRFRDGSLLVYNDPRRFGSFEKIPDLKAWREEKSWGPDPLDPDFDEKEFLLSLKKAKRSIKTTLMDQKILLGVGNIYASEALFLSGIRPTLMSSRIDEKRARKIWPAVRQVLLRAIDSGGSTLRDYRQLDGSAGEFKNTHNVYDRAGSPCRECETIIKSRRLAGRSTFWCPSCQK